MSVSVSEMCMEKQKSQKQERGRVRDRIGGQKMDKNECLKH